MTVRQLIGRVLRTPNDARRRLPAGGSYFELFTMRFVSERFTISLHLTPKEGGVLKERLTVTGAVHSSFLSFSPSLSPGRQVER